MLVKELNFFAFPLKKVKSKRGNLSSQITRSPENDKLLITLYLHNRTAGKDFSLYLRFRRAPSDSREISHSVFRRHRLPGAALSGHDDALVTLFTFQFRICFFGDRKDVWVQVAHSLTPVGLDGVSACKFKIPFM